MENGKKISVIVLLWQQALEIIEASVLFDIKGENIDVIVHPEHIVHGLVHYKMDRF